MRAGVWLIAIAGAVVACGCAQVSSTIGDLGVDYADVPQASIEQVASDIEAAIDAGEREPALAAPEGVSLDSDSIRQAIRTRAARAELIDEFLNSGFAYEKRNGLISIRRSSEYKRATTRRERDRHAVLVMGENNDRWALYEGMVKASGFAPTALDGIQKAFAAARVQYLEAGQLYEDESGETVAKQ